MTFLICSDGFWEYVLEDEMIKDLKETKSCKEWLQRMKKRLESKVGQDNDNHTAIAIQII